MEKEQMLKKIYEVIANKTLSFGCKIEVDMSAFEGLGKGRVVGRYVFQKVFGSGLGYIEFENNTIPLPGGNKTHGVLQTYDCIGNDSIEEESYVDGELNEKIIGHPVMIGDVLDWIKQNNTEPHQKFGGYTVKDINLNLRHSRQEKRKSIDEQSIECIEFIHSLLP